MFIQVIQGKVRDRDLMQRQIKEWRSKVKPIATGYLGSTGGIADDGTGIYMIRFESEDAARSNSDRPEQGQWWAATAPAFEGEPQFFDCKDVDVMFGGGSNDAKFIQIMQGRAVDREKMRSMGQDMEKELRAARPDIIGGLVAWHDDRNFTQAIYFIDEDSARKGEETMSDDPGSQEWESMLDGPLTFADIRNPDFD
jgi:hypothetical protein